MVALLQNPFKANGRKIKINDLNLKIGGEAGFGIMASGLIFAKAVNRAGLSTFGYVEYPSLVRGGHNTYQIKVTSKPYFAPEKQVDLLIALNKNTVDVDGANLGPFSGVIFNDEEFKLESSEFEKKNVFLYPVPLEKIATEVGGGKLVVNTVALGAALALVGLDFQYLSSVLTNTFRQKGEQVVNLNIKSARGGYDYVREKYADHFSFKLEKLDGPPKFVMSGNEAIALGAIAAGCKMYVSYPMTPSSSILHYLADHQLKADMIVKHCADEIEAIDMAIGGSFAGVRTAVGTSGGGFALMAESYGLAGILETPLVVINVQRPGPATGMPTWTGQPDLDFVMYAGQDEFPKIIIAPGDPAGAFYGTAQAFNLAAEYQTTVMILSDKFLGESIYGTEEFDTNKIKIEEGGILSESELLNTENYKRYEFTETGVSPRSLPGQKSGKYVANSYEHDEFGFVSEDPDNRVSMMTKRMKKLVTASNGLPGPTLYGEVEAKITLVGWGSSKGPILKALDLLKQEGISANFLHFVYISPFPIEATAKILSSAKKTLICEGNYTGQLARLIREKTGIEIKTFFSSF